MATNYLSIACSNGALDAVCLILNQSPSTHSGPSKVSLSPSSSPSLPVSSLSLSGRGPMPEIANDPWCIEYGQSLCPLLLAVQAGHEDIVAVLLLHTYKQYLLEHHQERHLKPYDVDISEDELQEGRLLDLVSIRNYRDSFGNSAMYHAIINGSIRTVAVLLYFDINAAFDVNSDEQGQWNGSAPQGHMLTALDLAKRCRQARIAQYLETYLRKQYHLLGIERQQQTASTLFPGEQNRSRCCCISSSSSSNVISGSSTSSSSASSSQSFIASLEQCLTFSVDFLERTTFRVTMVSLAWVYICLIYFCYHRQLAIEYLGELPFTNSFAYVGLIILLGSCILIMVLVGMLVWFMYHSDPGTVNPTESNGDDSEVGYIERSYISALERIAQGPGSLVCSSAAKSTSSSLPSPAGPRAFFPREFCCHYCHIYRPIRSAHSHNSHRCIPVFDHFCAFLWKDIGRDNYGHFVVIIGIVSVVALPSFLALLYIYWKARLQYIIKPLSMVIISTLKPGTSIAIDSTGVTASMSVIPRMLSTYSEYFRLLYLVLNSVNAADVATTGTSITPKYALNLTNTLSSSVSLNINNMLLSIHNINAAFLYWCTECIVQFILLFYSLWLGFLCFFLVLIFIFHVYLMSLGMTSVEYQLMHTSKLSSDGEIARGNISYMYSTPAGRNIFGYQCMKVVNKFSRSAVLANIIDRMSPSIRCSIYESDAIAVAMRDSEREYPYLEADPTHRWGGIYSQLAILSTIVLVIIKQVVSKCLQDSMSTNAVACMMGSGKAATSNTKAR
jgi:hypothetical protein